MTLSWAVIEANAVAFSERRKDAHSEKAQGQAFTLDFFRHCSLYILIMLLCYIICLIRRRRNRMQCTHCGSVSYVKNGSYKGSQRYLCNQ